MDNLINKIHNIDCFDVLSQLQNNSIDLIITDPPYMTTSFDYDKLAKNTLDLKKWFDEIIRVAKDTTPILIFASGKFTYKMVDIAKQYFRYELIWDKINKTSGFLDAYSRPMLNHELVLYCSKKNYRQNTYNHGVIVDKNDIKDNGKIPDMYKQKKINYKKINDVKFPKSILRFNKTSSNFEYIHPSEKPYGLIEYLIKLYSNENDVVLDTFSGSGVVAHVCSLNNRKFISCELNEEFYKKSILRLQNDMFVDYNQ
jgi:site-specific DNA-methyltransferase (adenine-specific)